MRIITELLNTVGEVRGGCKSPLLTDVEMPWGRRERERGRETVRGGGERGKEKEGGG